MALEHLQKIFDDPENKDCVWIVELVTPPGAFVARRLPEPIDREALNQEIDASAQALKKGPPRHRYVLFLPSCGHEARLAVEDLSRLIPNPVVPMPLNDLFSIQAVISAPW
jgi:hypothetical protein